MNEFWQVKSTGMMYGLNSRMFLLSQFLSFLVSQIALT